MRDILDGHVTLQLESLDRLYLNGYVPKLRYGAGLVSFLSQHRGHPIAWPALLAHITGKFVAEVKAFAQREGIPLFPFEHKQSKDRLVQQLRRQRTPCSAQDPAPRTSKHTRSPRSFRQ